MGIGVHIHYKQCLVILLAIILCNQNYSVRGDECALNWFNCGNGKCISRIFLCDGEDDCDNMQDEEDCGQVAQSNKIIIEECPKDQFHCEDKSHCIPLKWRCDGQKECADGSDEKNCESIQTCDGFQCKNKHCIPQKMRCDGMQDCSDGSDEHNCSSSKIHCPISEGHYLCSNGTCLNPRLVCNDKKDCPHGEDEGLHCNSSCSKMNCTQKCMRTPEGAFCYCNVGFNLAADNKTCVDINECRIDGYCSQKCVNKRGDAICSCYEGYTPVGNSCKASGANAILIFSDSVSIIMMPLRSNVTSYPLIHHGSTAFGLDYDLIDDRIYWAKTESQKNASIFSVNTIGKDARTELTWGLEDPQDIRIDWLGRNIYIVDRGLKSLLVCKLRTIFCHVILENIDNPRALALDPPSGLMYWSAWGKNAAIYKQGMDGSRMTKFVSKNLVWPNGLALDKISHRLYWTDAKTMAIEKINLDGSQRKVIVQDRMFHPYSIAVFEDNIYWTDWKKYSLDTCNKFTGRNYSIVYKDYKAPVGVVHIFHPVLYKFGSNPCHSSMCSHLCLLSPGGGFTCACIKGFSLARDGRTCFPDPNAPRLYLIEDREIYQITTEAVNHNQPLQIPISTENAADLAYASDTKTLYVGDNERHTISAINATNFIKKVVVAGNISEITGIDYDGEGRNLYWTDSTKGTIEMASTVGSYRKILVNGLKRPIDIALYPEKGLMFVALLGRGAHIAAFDMTGANYTKVEGSEGFAMTLCIDKGEEELYWGDVYKEKILAKNLNLGERTRELLTDIGHIVSIAVDEQNIYWLDEIGHSLNFADKKTLKAKKLHYTSYRTTISNIMIRKLAYANPLFSSGGICKNSNCSQLCIPSRTGPMCSCTKNFMLSNDSVSCIVAQCHPSLFRCGDGRCISMNKKCDGKTDCVDSSDEVDCSPTCGEKDFKCDNGRCVHILWRCDGVNDCMDNSDEENCTTLVTSLPRLCLIDHFRCQDGSCIPQELVCNLNPECPGGEDENKTYCATRQCSRGLMRCDSGQCIPEEWKCDKDADCFDNSDERDCSQSCKFGEFQCLNGLCIPKEFVCNKFNDCPQGEDERNCSKTCPEDKFACYNGLCIYMKDKCDKIKDCPNGEDELDCPVVCEDYEFSCLSGECVPVTWRCDGESDCKDGSDEKLPQCHNIVTEPPSTTTTRACPEEMFACYSGECIPASKVCDGERDCSDFSDERELCKEQCGSDNHGCAQICNAGPSGPFCQCVKGFQLADDKVSCLDVDECATIGSCSHFCINTKGSYSCACAKGYSLHGGQNCKANAGGNPYLMMLSGNQIRSIDLIRQSEIIIVRNTGNSSSSLDYIMEDKLVFWGDADEKVISYYSLSNRTTSVLLNTTDIPQLVAYDWIGKNYYYASNNNLYVCSRQGDCLLLLQLFANKITAFALAPIDGLLFLGVETYISKMGMDGDVRSYNRIIHHKIERPSAIAVDEILKDIYWVEFKRNLISAADYYGQERRLVTSDVNFPFALALFEDNLYWSEVESDGVFSCNKFTGKGVIMIIRGSTVKQLTVVHPVLRSTEQNPCEEKCDQLCLLKNKISVCKCADGFQMVSGKCQLLEVCTSDYCQNDGICDIVERSKRCRCAIGYEGDRCENIVQTSSKAVQRKESGSGWITGVVIGIMILCCIVAFYFCFKNKSSIHAHGRNIIVSFRHTLQREEPLIIDSEYSEHDMERERLRGENDLYNKTECGGGYKRWQNIDSELERSLNVDGSDKP